MAPVRFQNSKFRGMGSEINHHTLRRSWGIGRGVVLLVEVVESRGVGVVAHGGRTGDTGAAGDARPKCCRG
jgi:hypothetical protein